MQERLNECIRRELVNCGGLVSYEAEEAVTAFCQKYGTVAGDYLPRIQETEYYQGGAEVAYTCYARGGGRVAFTFDGQGMLIKVEAETYDPMGSMAPLIEWAVSPKEEV